MDSYPFEHMCKIRIWILSGSFGSALSLSPNQWLTDTWRKKIKKREKKVNEWLRLRQDGQHERMNMRDSESVKYKLTREKANHVMMNYHKVPLLSRKPLLPCFIWIVVLYYKRSTCTSTNFLKTTLLQIYLYGTPSVPQ